MGVRVLESVPVAATEKASLWIDDSNGYAMVMTSDRGCIAAADTDGYARAARFALEAGPLAGKSVAWIGGGLCLGPRLFALMGSPLQRVLEIEPSLREFCPEDDDVEFIPGDWRDTISGKFDVIVYDLGTATPDEVKLLTSHLNPGGDLLGVES